MENTVHNLKTIAPHWDNVWFGFKTFEIRKDDRDYKNGDILILEEWDNRKKLYTGRRCAKIISMVHRDLPEFGLMDGYCIISFTS